MLFAALGDAQAILRRLRCRDLYKIVGDRLLSPEQAVHASKAATPQQIASCADASYPLNADDIIVHQLKINYALKDKNPVDSVSFYNANDDFPFHLPKSKVSLMIPDVFEEKFEPQNIFAAYTLPFIHLTVRVGICGCMLGTSRKLKPRRRRGTTF